MLEEMDQIYYIYKIYGSNILNYFKLTGMTSLEKNIFMEFMYVLCS